MRLPAWAEDPASLILTEEQYDDLPDQDVDELALEDPFPALVAFTDLDG